MLIFSSAPAGVGDVIRAVTTNIYTFFTPDYTDQPGPLPSFNNPIVQPSKRGEQYSNNDILAVEFANQVIAGIQTELPPAEFNPNAPGDTLDNAALVGRPEPVPKDVPQDPLFLGDPIGPGTGTTATTTGTSATTATTSTTATTATTAGTTAGTTSTTSGSSGSTNGTGSENPPPATGPGPAFPWEGTRPSGGSEFAPSDVNTQTGNRITTVPIVGWKGKGGIPMGVSLINNSQDSGDVGAGEKWRTSVDFRLLRAGDYGNGDTESIVAIYPSGRRLVFKRARNQSSLDNRFYPPTGFYDIIYRNVGNYTLRTKDQMVYVFNLNGMLTSYRDRFGNTVTISGQGPGLPDLTLTGQGGETIVLDYEFVNNDTTKHLVKVTAPGNRVWDIVYKLSPPTSGKRVIGTITYPVLDTAGNTRPVETFNYDNSQKIIEEIDAIGRSWKYEYNLDQKLTKFKTPNQHAMPVGPNEFDYVKLDYYSDRTEVANWSGEKTTDYYSSGLLKAVKDESNYVTSFTYDASYNVDSEKNPRQFTSFFEYDQFGNLRKFKDPRMAANNVFAETRYNAYNDVIEEYDTRGAKTTYNRNSVTGVVNNVVNGLNQTVGTYTYNSDGTLHTAFAEGATTTLGYNSLGQLYTVSGPDGNATILYGTGTSSSKPISVTDNRARTTQFAYDSWGRLKQKIRSDGATTTTNMNVMGWVTSSLDVLNRTTTVYRDVLGRVYRVTNARGDNEYYTFDNMHRVNSVKNGNGFFRYYNYTPRGELVNIQFADGTQEIYKYDGNGNKTRRINGLNQTISYGYDSVDNLSSVTYPDQLPSSFTYDNDGRQITLGDSTGSHTWAYNFADQLTQLTTPQGTMGYEYDTWGRRTKLIEGTAETVYTYQNDKLYTVNKAADGVSSTFTYDAYGRLDTKYANGLATTYGYDSLDRVQSIVHQNGSTTLHQETYNYDYASNLTSKLVNSVATYYTYDDIDQLLTENGGGVANTYTYDHNGNRLTKTSSGSLTTYDYDGADKLLHAYLPGSVTRTYQYDNAGRTTVISGAGYNRTFTWNSDDHLTSLSGSGMATTSYAYNGVGTRVYKSNSVGSRTYKRDGVNVTAPVLTDGVSTMVPGLSERHSGANKSIAYDRLGSMKALVSSGVITDTAEFDAFGVSSSRTGTTNTQKGFVNSAGYQEDDESGYKLLGHRYYDPEIGRFLSRDPVLDGTNWYAYVFNNPLKAFDANGLNAALVWGVRDPVTGLLTAGVALVGLLIIGFVQVADDVAEIGKEAARKMAKRKKSNPEGEPKFPPIPGPSITEEDDSDITVGRMGNPDGSYWAYEDPMGNRNFPADYGIHTPRLGPKTNVSQAEISIAAAIIFSRPARSETGKHLRGLRMEIFIPKAWVPAVIKNPRIKNRDVPTSYWEPHIENSNPDQGG